MRCYSCEESNKIKTASLRLAGNLSCTRDQLQHLYCIRNVYYFHVYYDHMSHGQNSFYEALFIRAHMTPHNLQKCTHSSEKGSELFSQTFLPQRIRTLSIHGPWFHNLCQACFCSSHSPSKKLHAPVGFTNIQIVADLQQQRPKP